MNTRWVSGALVVVLAAGCGVAVESFPTESAKTVCKKIYECCNAGEVANNQLYGPDQATCEKNLAKALDSSGLVKTGVSKGRLVYSGDLVSKCLEQYSKQTCDQLKSNATTSTPACDAYLEPKVQSGAACDFDKECIGGSCEGAGFAVEGVCTPLLAENAGCADGGTCGDGLYCEGQCKRLKSDGTACLNNGECATGGCNGRDAGVAGTCGLKGGAGTTCYATDGCASAPGPVLLCGGLLLLLALSRRSALGTRR